MTVASSIEIRSAEDPAYRPVEFGETWFYELSLVAPAA
jgi:hypothetical protein